MPDIVSAGQTFLICAVIAYLVGSIPFGLIVSRVMGLGNLREIGSGNIGATNVLRTGSKAAAFLTLLLDGGKGVVVVLFAKAYGAPDAAQLAALMVMVGHCFPISWRQGRGNVFGPALRIGLANRHRGMFDVVGDGSGIPVFILGGLSRCAVDIGVDASLGRATDIRALCVPISADLLATRGQHPPTCGR